MADFTVTLTVDDAKVANLIAAINWNDPPKDQNGNPAPDRNGAQCRAWFKATCVQALKDIYKRHQEYLKSQQAIDTDLPVT